MPGINPGIPVGTGILNHQDDAIKKSQTIGLLEENDNICVMSTKILVVAATDMEAVALKTLTGLMPVGNSFSYGKLRTDLLVTGVGTVATAYALTKELYCRERPEIAINIGIAGSYRTDLANGTVVVVRSDLFGDAGIETTEGIMSLFDAGLGDPSGFPFKEGRLPGYEGVDETVFGDLIMEDGITLNSASTSQKTIKSVSERYNPGIETMEGAAFSYICASEKVPFLALRSVSNPVGERDKSMWDIPMALENLSVSLKYILDRIK